MITKEKIDCQRERRIRHRLSENACNTHILCPDSSLYFVLFYYCILDRFLHFCSHLPLSSASLTLSPTSGDSLQFFILAFYISEKQFTCFPSSGDGLKLTFFPLFPNKQKRLFYISHFYIFVFIYIKIMISFFLSRCFPRTRREVPSLRGDRGKGAYTG